MIRALPKKNSSSDLLRTSVLKDCIDLLSPFITNLFNLSLSAGVFPTSWKYAIVTPILKKTKCDLNNPASYRPISNLLTLAKVLERLVSKQLRCFLNTNNLLLRFNLAIRPTILLKRLCSRLPVMSFGIWTMATYVLCPSLTYPLHSILWTTKCSFVDFSFRLVLPILCYPGFIPIYTVVLNLSVSDLRSPLPVQLLLVFPKVRSSDHSSL